MEPKPATSLSSRHLRLTAISVSLIGGIAILGIKFYAAAISNSSALRSDALEGTVNVLAAAFGLGSIIFAERPADRDHPYGHGKIEYFAQAFEGGLIALAAFLILADTIIRIAHQQTVHDLGLGLKLSVISGALNGILGAGIYAIGKKHHSRILIADGIHLLADLVTTIVLTVGLLIVYFTHIWWLDSVLAVGVALFLFKTGYSLVSSSADALLDAENPILLQEIVDQLNAFPRGGIITAHALKAQQFGRDTHLDLHLVVPEFFSIKEAHAESDRISGKLIECLGFDSIVHTHIDPCERKFCIECKQENCPIRVKSFEAVKTFTVDLITDPGKH